jgi:hypothetical protein
MSKPQSILLYAAETRLTDDHQPVRANDGSAIIYIRASVVRGDAVGALSKHDAAHNETLLNSIPHPHNP